jgi:hypothetical protein
MSYRKAQTSIQKKKKFSTFSARDFKEAKKQFSSNSINSNSDCIKTPSANRRSGHCGSGTTRNRAWTSKKANRINNDITSSDNVKVFVRLRPTNNNSTDNKTDKYDFTDSNDDDEDTLEELQEKNIAKVTNHSITLGSRSETSKRFTFDNLFNHDSRQSDIFEEVGKPVVDAAIKGYNGSVFAYGQTGSGKTYTMLGTPENPGLIPRVIQHLFSKLHDEDEDFTIRNNDNKNHVDENSNASNNNCEHENIKSVVDSSKSKHVIRVSYLEIYNETVLDLLDIESGTKQLRENIKRGVYVDKLVEKKVNTPDEAAEWMAVGNNNRKTASTAMNSQSSRSHAVFTLTIEMSIINKNTGVRITRYSRVNLVDLAGSERQRDTLVTGARLKEASTINKSLSTLGNVIMSLVDIANTGTARHVHYRDSKLTFLLRDSLGGNTRTSMIATISPKEKNYAESLSTLKFAQRAKYIRNKVTANEDAAGTADSLRKEIKRLKERMNKMLLEKKNSGSNKNAEANSKTNSAISLACNNCKNGEQNALKYKTLLLKQDKVWTLKITKMNEKLKQAYEQVNKAEDKLESFKLKHAMSNRRDSSVRESGGRFSPLSNILEEEEEDTEKTMEDGEEATSFKIIMEKKEKNAKTRWRQSIDNLRRESKDSIENKIEDQSFRIQIQHLNEENSKLKSALHCSQDEKETMQDEIDELKSNVKSLTCKLKTCLNKNLTPQKKLPFTKQKIATPDNVRKIKDDYKQVKYERDITKRKLSQAQRDLNSASSAAITLQKELSTKRNVLREMESNSMDVLNELKDLKAQLEEAKKHIADKKKIQEECQLLKEKIVKLEQQRNLNPASFMNLSTTAGAALNRFGLGVAGFAQKQQQQQQGLSEPSTANVVQQGIINTLEKALAKSKKEVETLKSSKPNNDTSDDEYGDDMEDYEKLYEEHSNDENVNNNVQLGIDNKMKKKKQIDNNSRFNRNSSIGSNASTSSSVQIYKYESPQKTMQANTSGARFSVAKYFPGGEKFKSVKRRSSSVYSDEFGDKRSNSVGSTLHDDIL